MVGRGDDTIGNPHRAQMYQFELFELILLLKLDKQCPVEQFEATGFEVARGHTSNLSHEEFTRLAEARLAQHSLIYIKII